MKHLPKLDKQIGNRHVSLVASTPAGRSSTTISGPRFALPDSSPGTPRCRKAIDTGTLLCSADTADGFGHQISDAGRASAHGTAETRVAYYNTPSIYFFPR
jgi:hypothetical protein